MVHTEEFVMKILLSLLVLLLLIGGVVATAYFVNQASMIEKQSAVVSEEQMVGNDRDEHGCIGSAGYSWCEAKQLCLRPWEEACETEDALQLIRQALFLKNGWTDDSIEVTLSSNDGTYANGLVQSGGGGGYFFAIKEDLEWKIVADGNGMIDCQLLTEYPDYPTTLIPECYDFQTETSVKR
jgi:hypothetical protein